MIYPAAIRFVMNNLTITHVKQNRLKHTFDMKLIRDIYIYQKKIVKNSTYNL